jgi:hypothetical protein
MRRSLRLEAKRKVIDSVTCESNQDSVNDGKVDAFLIFLLNSSS